MTFAHEIQSSTFAVVKPYRAPTIINFFSFFNSGSKEFRPSERVQQVVVDGYVEPRARAGALRVAHGFAPRG